MRFSPLLLLFSLISFFQATAQRSNFKIDSLNTQLKSRIADTTRVHSLARLAQAYEGIDSTLTFKNAFKALKLATEIKYKRGMAHANLAIGSSYMDYYDPDKAEEYLELAVEQAEHLYAYDGNLENLKLLTTAKHNLATTFSNRGNHTKGIPLTYEVIELLEKQNNAGFLANVHNNLGITYMNLAQVDDAYRNFKISEALFETVNSPKNAIFNKLSLISCLDAMDSVPAMKKTLDELRTLFEITPESTDRHFYHTQLGLYYTKIEQYGNAIASYDKGLALLKKNKLMVNLAPLYQKYAFTYEKKGDYDKAINYINKYIEISRKIKKPISVFQGYYKRALYEAKLNNYKNAYHDYVAAIDIYDSIETAKNIEKINELDIKYQSAEKEREILALKNVNSESELSLERKKSEAYLLVGIISLLSLLLFSGYYVYNRKIRNVHRKERIRETEVQLLKQEQEIKLSSAMIEGQEKERKRLAIDLHDGLGGRLSGISLNLSKLNKDEPKEYPKEQLQKVIKDLDDSLTELRTIARNMMPETLMKFGLQAALKDYCSSMTGNETKVMLQFYGSEKKIDLNQRVTIYRIIQELINNAIKHAKATEILVQYMREENRVDITVEDNGIGFKKEAIENKNGSGMGLSNLRTRVAYLKGNLEFHSQENEGTTVNVNITLNENAA